MAASRINNTAEFMWVEGGVVAIVAIIDYVMRNASKIKVLKIVSVDRQKHNIIEVDQTYFALNKYLFIE